MAKQPKDLEYRAEYEPDMDRMVKALRILLEWVPEKEDSNGQVPGKTLYFILPGEGVNKP